ncbi:uncharacterized protein LOC144075003 [Stigmatopora argus]
MYKHTGIKRATSRMVAKSLAKGCSEDQRRKKRTKLHNLNLNSPVLPLKNLMARIQLLRVFLLSFLAVHQCLTMTLQSQCLDDSICTYNFEDYYSQMGNLPNRINERSIAPWDYIKNIDLNRIPQVISEASCHTSHSCRGLDNTFGLETIPVALRMPVLKKNPSCFPTASYSLEFELINIACICAIARHS